MQATVCLMWGPVAVASIHARSLRQPHTSYTVDWVAERLRVKFQFPGKAILS